MSSPTPTDWARLVSLTVHEFRTPMTIVAGYIRMLLRDTAGPLSEQQRKLLTEAERSCGRLSGLISELSELGRLEDGRATLNRGTLNASALVDEAAAALQALGDRAVPVVTRSDNVDVFVNGDATRLREAIRSVLQAILREAVLAPEFLVDRSAVTLEGTSGIRIVAGDPRAVETLSGSSELSAFDEWRGGSGLTLPIARRVIEAHGGRLAAPTGELAKIGVAIFLPATSANPAATPSG